MMKRITLVILILFTMVGIGHGQAPIKRKKTEKIEQTQSASSRQNQQQTSNNKKKVQSSVKVSEPDGYINGHGYVDLGLPSGLKWATCNVGAKKPQDYGGYYAWGEIKPKSSYDWNNCFDCLGFHSNEYRWEIYNGEDEREISPYSGHDTARENWGGTWRMPTATELKELVGKCTFEWTKMNGINGCLVTGPNGKSIFLPAAGFRYEGEGVSGFSCLLWSSSLHWSPYEVNTSSSGEALDKDNNTHEVSGVWRKNGLSVRPVAE